MKLFTKIILFILLSIVSATSLKAQKRVHTIKPIKSYPTKTNFAIGAGFSRSVLFLSRNVKENNDANGYNFSVLYGGSRIVRVSLEYTYYRPINIEPTWFNINASSIESNAHIIARFKNTKAFFYPLFGLSYNHFSGFFTGRNDFLNLREKYQINSVVSTNWLGLNVGTGYEQFFKQISLFLDYKMRVGFNDGINRQINIMDVCISAGLRYNIKVPSIYKLIKGNKTRYFLDTE